MQNLLTLSHSRAASAMAVAAVLVSSAGFVAKQLQTASGFESAFVRSATAALLLLVVGLALYGRSGLVAKTLDGGLRLAFSAACWCVMLTSFMVAVSMTTVANVLVVLAIDPLLTTLMARVTLGSAIPRKTWIATAGACAGVLMMFGSEADGEALLGTAIAFLVPLAAAANWTLSQSIQQSTRRIDLLPALLYGTVMSAAVSFALSGTLQGTPRDYALLVGLGVFQCAIPCTIAIICARTLKAPELALLALLELVCGTALVWVTGTESVTWSKFLGASIVLASILVHELWCALPTRLKPAGAE
jgi:drug/metabolite transporter (DMT)-like permease